MSDILAPINSETYKISKEVDINTPGILKIIKRNGNIVVFDASKIQVAITKAYIAVEGSNAVASNRIHNQIEELTKPSKIIKPIIEP